MTTNKTTKKETKITDNKKKSASPIETKTNYVNGLGASAEFTSVD